MNRETLNLFSILTSGSIRMLKKSSSFVRARYGHTVF